MSDSHRNYLLESQRRSFDPNYDRANDKYDHSYSDGEADRRAYERAHADKLPELWKPEVPPQPWGPAVPAPVLAIPTPAPAVPASVPETSNLYVRRPSRTIERMTMSEVVAALTDAPGVRRRAEANGAV